MLSSVLNNIVLSSTLVNLSSIERQDPKAQEIFSRLSLGFQVKIAFDLLEKAFPKHFEHYPLTNRVRLLCYSLPLISLLTHKLLKKTQLENKYAYIDTIFQKTGTASKVAIIFASYQLTINNRQMESGLVLVVLAFSTLNSRKVINFDNSRICHFLPKMVKVIDTISQVMGLFHENNPYKLCSIYTLGEKIASEIIPFYFPLKEDKQTEAETIALLQAQVQIKSESTSSFDVPEVAFNMDYLKNLRTIPAYFKSLEDRLKRQSESLLRENPKGALDKKTYAELHILGYLQNRREEALRHGIEDFFWNYPKALHPQIFTITFGKFFGLPIQDTKEGTEHLGYAGVKIQECKGWFIAKYFSQNVTKDLYYLAEKIAEDEIPFSVIKDWWKSWCDQNNFKIEDKSNILITLANEKNKLRELMNNSDVSWDNQFAWFEKSETLKLYKKMLLEMKFLIQNSTSK